jgi:hypothetical protein
MKTKTNPDMPRFFTGIKEGCDGSKSLELIRIIYFKDGKLHREDGPTVEQFDGRKEWYLNGQRHREDGPSVIFPNGNENWSLYGVWYSDEKATKAALKTLKKYSR